MNSVKVSFFIFLISRIFTLADGPESWKRIEPIQNEFQPIRTRPGVDINDITFGDSAQNMLIEQTSLRHDQGWLAVGDDGLILNRSNRFNSFERLFHKAPPETDFYTVRYNQGVWLITGENGIILTSDNKFQWNIQKLDASVNWIDQSFSQGKWIIVGWENNSSKNNVRFESFIATSTDALNWSIKRIPNLRIQSVAADSSKWILAGQHDQDPSQSIPALLSSTDAVKWEPVSLDKSLLIHQKTFRHVNFYQDHWIGVTERHQPDGDVESDLLFSRDGKDWQLTLSVPGKTSKPRHGQDEWIFLTKPNDSSNSAILYQSGDGRDWNIVDSISPNLTLGQSAFSAEGIRMIVGKSGNSGSNSILRSNRYRLLSSDQKSDIKMSVKNYENSWLAVAHSGQLLISDDGQNWTPITTPFEEYPSVFAFGKKQWVLFGAQGGVWTSQDRLQWTKVATLENFSPLFAKFSNDQWVVVGNNKENSRKSRIYSSENLKDFHQFEFDTLPLKYLGLAYGNGFWLVQNISNFFRSEDGIHWEKIEDWWMKDLCSLAYGDGYFITSSCQFGGQGYLVSQHRSADGKNWQHIRMNGGPTWYKNGIWWCNRLSMDVSFNQIDSIESSTDGIHWNTLISYWDNNFEFEWNTSTDIDIEPTDEGFFLCSISGARYEFGSNIIGQGLSAGPNRPTKIAHGVGSWLVAIDQEIYLAKDGFNWSKIASTEYPIEDIAFGGGVYGYVDYARELMGTRSHWRTAFYLLEPGIGSSKQLQISGRQSGPIRLRYHFEKWWLLVGRDIYIFDHAFNPRKIFMGSGQLTNAEVIVDISFSNEAVIAVTNFGTIFRTSRSTDFQDWTRQTIEDRLPGNLHQTDVSIQDIAYGDAEWMLVSVYNDGSDRTLWIERSKDGILWNGYPVETSNLIDDRFSAKLGYGEGRWVLSIGGHNSSRLPSFKIFSSEDGKHWEQNYAFAYPTVSGPIEVLYHENHWFVNSPYGILRSGPISWLATSIEEQTGKPLLELRGVPNQRSNIQTSTDLENWQAWKSVKIPLGPAVINLPKSKENKAQFYRLAP